MNLALFRVGVPRRDDDSKCRPFDLKVLDLDILLEINPNGQVIVKLWFPSFFYQPLLLQQQTVLTLGALDLSVLNATKGGTKETFFNLTAPHSLVCTPVKPAARIKVLQFQ